MTAAKTRKVHKSVKTITAENVRLRVPLAYFGTEKHPLEHPIFGSAYKRDEGLVLIALVNREHQEVVHDERIVVSYDPAAVEATGLRWCQNCSEAKANGRHLRRIGPDKYATAYCDVREKEYQAAYKEGRKFRQSSKQEDAEERQARIERVMSQHEKSKRRLVASMLRNIAASTDYAHEDKKWAHFDSIAAQYGLSRAEGIELAEAIYPELSIDQSKAAS